MSKEYDELLARIKKGEKYLDDNTVPMEEREHWVKPYQELVAKLNAFNDIDVQDQLIGC